MLRTPKVNAITDIAFVKERRKRTDYFSEKEKIYFSSKWLNSKSKGSILRKEGIAK